MVIDLMKFRVNKNPPKNELFPNLAVAFEKDINAPGFDPTKRFYLLVFSNNFLPIEFNLVAFDVISRLP